MITVHRLNGDPILINNDQIRSVECKPDTLITFVDGKTILVKESPDEVKRLISIFKRSCIQGEHNNGI